MKKQRRELSIEDIFGIFLPKLWLIVAVALVCSIVAAFYSAVIKPRTYTSSTEMYVYRSDQAITSTDYIAAQNMLGNYKRVLLSDDFLNKVATRLIQNNTTKDPGSGENKVDSKYVRTASEIRGMIVFSMDDESTFFKVSVTSTSNDVAYQVAKIIESEAPEAVMDLLPNALLITPVDSPKFPLSANSKNTTRNTIVAFAIGAVVTAVLILLISMFDFVVRDKKKLESTFDMPVLGVIPRQIISEEHTGGERSAQV
jgi:capsular polysaccharide biosynthesis protein